jgi:general L-amino acid transport system substrate-binding protein
LYAVGLLTTWQTTMVYALKYRSKLMWLLAAAFLAVLYSPVHTPSALAGDVLQHVRANGIIRCGVNNQVTGFARQDENGRWRGFSVDFCRAVAVAVLGDPEKVNFTPMSAPNRFPTLLSCGVDLLAHTATWTLGREGGVGIEFPAIYFYDSQVFAVKSDNKKIQRLEDLDNMTLCAVKGTTHSKNMTHFFKKRGMSYTPLQVDSGKDLVRSLAEGRCQACTSERSLLTALLQTYAKDTERFTILPEAISKEPLAPAVLRKDVEWATMVRWVLFALIEAEERGVTSANVRSLQKETADPDLQWFLNSCGEGAKALGLKPDWVADVIASVGNYGEIYERNLGSGSTLKLDRGLNRLWKDGGLLYAPSFQ